MAAHASLWLVVCGIMMLSVGLPHASSHPTPDDNQNQEVMSYYPPAQEQQQHYYPSYDYEEEDDEKKNLQDYEPVLAENIVAGRAEAEEGGPRQVTLTSSKDKGLDIYLQLLKVVGAFYFAWVMIFPVLRDTNAFGISDLLGYTQSTKDQVPELKEILDKNSTLQVPAVLDVDEKKTKRRVMKPLRRFETNYKNKKNSKNVGSKQNYLDFVKSLAWIPRTVWNMTNSLVQSGRDSGDGFASSFFRLDPVDIALNLLGIDNQPLSRCRERLVCDARRMASALPYVDYYLPHATSREDFNPAYKYEEAAFIGAQNKDCSVFSCPQTSLELLTGGL